MARPDGRIEKGQRIRSAISARAWNRAQDAADRVLGAGTGATGGGYSGADPAPNIVLIKNTSGQDVPMCGVLGISGVEIDPSGGNLTGTADADKRAREFVSRPVLTGVTPTTAHAESFVVTLEPIANNKIGRAAVGGAFACKVNVTNASHRFATAKNDDGSQLQSAACGVLQLVWKETGTGANKWAVGVM
jgi:hypothetical protein